MRSTFFTSTLEPKSSNEMERRVTTAEDRRSTELAGEADSSGDVALDLLPKKLWCRRCLRESLSEVHLELPTLSVWKVICCVNDLVTCCTKPDLWERYQRIHHRCAYCHFSLVVYEPKHL